MTVFAVSDATATTGTESAIITVEEGSGYTSGVPHTSAVTITDASRGDYGIGSQRTARASVIDNDFAPGTGRVWLDANEDAVINPTEEGVAALTVQLLQRGNVIASAVSGVDGYYQFPTVPPGIYTVRAVDPVTRYFTNTLDGFATGPVTVGADGQVPAVDFGLHDPTVSPDLDLQQGQFIAFTNQEVKAGAYVVANGQTTQITANDIQNRIIKNLSLPDAEKLKQSGLDGVTTAKDFKDLVTLAMNDLAVKAKDRREYASETQFINDALTRAYTVVFSQVLVTKVKFPSNALARFAQDKTNSWDEAMVDYMKDGKNIPQAGLKLRDGAKASDGIKEFFGANAGFAQLDCATFQIVATRRALLEVLGETAYNTEFKGKPLAGFYADNGLSNRIAAPRTLLVGDGVTFNYLPTTKLPPEKEAYRLENTLYLGNGLVLGHPFAKPLKDSEMVNKIEDETGVKGVEIDNGGFNGIDFSKLPK